MPSLSGLSALSEVIAPARCFKCLNVGSWLCTRCHLEISAVRYALACPVCQRAQARGLTCHGCSTESALTGLVSLGPYHTSWLRRGIHWLKFKGVRSCAPELADLLVSKLTVIAPREKLSRQADLIPVPLHRGRLRQRGFNQSELLAQYLAQITAIPIMIRLSRSRATAPQTQLPTALRQDNIKDAFVLSDKTKTRKTMAIIIDDVATSGATLSAAAHTLQTAGYRQIWGLTLARG